MDSLIPAVHLAAASRVAVASSIKFATILPVLLPASGGEIADDLLALILERTDLRSCDVEQVHIVHIQAS